MKRLAALTLTFGLLPAQAVADDIQWLSAEFPPMVMSKGAYARQGYINALFDYVQAQLPQHRFTEVILPWPRVMHMAAQGGPYCLIAAFKTPEREAFLRFTEPYGYLIPLGLVAPAIHAERLKPYLNANGQVSLEALMARHDLHPGVASGRSYGPQIDHLLAAEAHPTQIHQSESTHALFQMLSLGRIDYSFSYPSELLYYSANHQALRFYPIEGSDELLPGRFSCTRSPETNRVFADIQQLMQRGEHRAVFKASYERWLPEELLPAYRQKQSAIP